MSTCMYVCICECIRKYIHRCIIESFLNEEFSKHKTLKRRNKKQKLQNYKKTTKNCGLKKKFVLFFNFQTQYIADCWFPIY